MQFFHLKFAVTSVIKIYSKVWELWMHLDYDHLYIPLTSKKTILLVKKAYFKSNFFRFEILSPQANK